jgi:hypothetical protein
MTNARRDQTVTLTLILLARSNATSSGPRLCRITACEHQQQQQQQRHHQHEQQHPPCWSQQRDKNRTQCQLSSNESASTIAKPALVAPGSHQLEATVQQLRLPPLPSARARALNHVPLPLQTMQRLAGTRVVVVVVVVAASAGPQQCREQRCLGPHALVQVRQRRRWRQQERHPRVEPHWGHGLQESMPLPAVATEWPKS